MKSRFWIGSALVLGVLGAAAVLLTGTDEQPMAAGRGPAPAMTVTTTTPGERNWPSELVANGAIEAWQEATIGAQLGGLRVREVLVDVGTTVRRGQLLATLDESTLRAQRAELAAAVAEAEAAARQAQANRDRALAVKASGALSQQQVQQYVTESEVAVARIDSARARLHSNEVELGFARILAPDDGVISQRTATVGSVTQPGQELFRLVRQNRLEWRAQLTAEQVTRVRQGQTALVTLPDGGTLRGTVRQVSPTLDPQSRIALAYVDLEAGSVARAGMYLPGRLQLGEGRLLAVPAASVVMRDGRMLVFTVEQAPGGNARVAARRVETGRRVGTEIEILGGIDASASLVVEGAGFLNDGDLVRVVAPDA
jgi:RND family efflux transporter MFP subunit